LEEQYGQIIGDATRWREHARYYAVRPPLELREEDLSALEEVAQANEDVSEELRGQEPDINGHRTEPHVASESPDGGQRP
jgi:hypothetical protein